MEKIKTQLAADTIHGVYVCEIPGTLDRPGPAVLVDGDFLAALSTVADGETIHGLVSDEIAKQIEAVYGIR